MVRLAGSFKIASPLHGEAGAACFDGVLFARRTLKLNPQSQLRSLMDNFPHTGRLEWISVRPTRREPIVEVAYAETIAGRGLVGDRCASAARNSKRQVTLIQAEHLVPVAQLMRADAVRPAMLRRNLVVSGINILALKDQVFTIGEVVLEGTGRCEPCSRMEENLGPGGCNAMRGHGGITARIIEGGVLHIGDPVRAGRDTA